jgi:hypothetical protein
LVDGVGDEGGKWSETFDESKEDFEERVECVLCIVEPELSL